MLWILGRDVLSRTLIFCLKQNSIVLPVTFERLFIKLWICRSPMFCQKQNTIVLPEADCRTFIPTQKPQLIRECYIILWILDRDVLSRTLILCQKQNTIVLTEANERPLYTALDLGYGWF